MLLGGSMWVLVLASRSTARQNDVLSGLLLGNMDAQVAKIQQRRRQFVDFDAVLQVDGLVAQTTKYETFDANLTSLLAGTVSLHTHTCLL